MVCTHTYKKKQTHTDFNLREIEKSEGVRGRESGSWGITRNKTEMNCLFLLLNK